MKQAFTAENLQHLVRRNDVIKHRLGRTKAMIKAAVAQASREILDPSYELTALNPRPIGSAIAFTPTCFRDELAIRKVDDNIKRATATKTADRSALIAQLKLLLSEAGELWVVKLDISKFFESINRADVVLQISENHQITFDTKRVLTKIFRAPALVALEGLPRGLCISATLSEFVLQQFDAHCRQLPGCYFFARYVDDAIMLFDRDPRSFSGDIVAALPKGLQFNSAKCRIINRPLEKPVATYEFLDHSMIAGERPAMTYLGYEFLFGRDAKRPTLSTGITEKKIVRAKRRATLAFASFCKKPDFHLLERRIQFLTSNYRIRDNDSGGAIYSGVYYNNIHIDPDRVNDLQPIDNHIRSLIYARQGSLGRVLTRTLLESERRRLKRLSAVIGFKQKIVRNFSRDELYRIKKVWRHV